MTANNYKGVINVYKEPGYTSHDVVAIVRKTLGIKRVGHTGTLDPNAEGVLPICVGTATKLADYIAANDKTYVADLILGHTTDTGDVTGEVLTRQEDEMDYSNVIEEVISSFAGDQLQTPPMYSAIKIGGQKLYQLARKGVTIERKPRPIYIHSLKILAEIDSGYRIEVNCSKGTYIRSLCMDIGAKLGCGAVMGRLVRTKSGQFRVEDAVKLDVIKAANHFEPLILAVDKVLPYPAVQVKPEGIAMAVNGNPLPLRLVDGNAFDKSDKCWLYSGDKIIGLFAKSEKKSNKLYPEVML